jgi:hypothetical protein
MQLLEEEDRIIRRADRPGVIDPPESDALADRARVTDLVRAAQAGDRAAFGQLAVRYERSVQALALRTLGDHAEAQELAQEVFVQALRKLDQLRVPEACVAARPWRSSRKRWRRPASRSARRWPTPWTANSGPRSGPVCGGWARLTGARWWRST